MQLSFEEVWEALVVESGKPKALFLAKEASKDYDKLEFLINKLYSEKDREGRMAAWCIDHLSNTHNFQVAGILETLIHSASIATDNTQIGITFRTLLKFKLHEDIENIALLLNQCFVLMKDLSKRMYIRVNSIRILYQITRSIPELKPELKLAIEEIYPFYQERYMKKVAKEILERLESEI
jgi:hypothetical protein